MNQRFRRRKKLIKPRLQLKLIGTFVAVSAIGFLLQAQLIGARLSALASSLPSGGSELQAEVPSLLVGTLLVSFLLLLPVTVAVGILATFRIAGPIKRFEMHFAQIARGEDAGPCRIRKGDELQELCDLINQALADLEQKGTPARDTPHEERSAA